MLFRVREAAGTPYHAGTWISADGQTQVLQGEQIQLQALAWSKQDNGVEMPTRWRVQVPSQGVDLQVDALEPKAWMHTSFPYWEGPVRISGSVGGRGYLEMTGY
ncbi:Hydroxyneurosporene synthase (CrtC) [compost metagenome]